jgi:hypothetical protein
VLTLRFKAGEPYAAHRAHYPQQRAPEVLARLAPATRAVLDGDFIALRALCAGHRPTPDPGERPPPAPPRACWHLGRNARAGVGRGAAAPPPKGAGEAKVKFTGLTQNSHVGPAV